MYTNTNILYMIHLREFTNTFYEFPLQGICINGHINHAYNIFNDINYINM